MAMKNRQKFQNEEEEEKNTQKIKKENLKKGKWTRVTVMNNRQVD